MGDFLTLDDGRTLVRSSMAIAGILALTAKELSDSEDELRTWLDDVSDRPDGFSSIDLRGLSKGHRLAFRRAAQTAYRQLSSRELNVESSSPTYHAMTDLLAMFESMSRGEPPGTPPTDVVNDEPAISEEVTQIWKADVD